MSIWCDRVITAGIVFLILFTPLAFGSVHPWAFSLMEAAIFLLVLAWTGKLIFLAKSQVPSANGLEARFLRSLTLPLALFLGLILFQLLPLPPSLLQLLSPSTYNLYSRTLPGWPGKIPYEDLSFRSFDAQERARWVLLPTLDEVNKGAPVTAAGREAQASDSKEGLSTPRRSTLSSNWLPLSIAPSLTRTDLLKFTAYAGLFFLVLLYPFGSSPTQKAEERFVRWLLLTVLLSGFLVAAISLVQRLSWNGKILWFFVPYDWGVAIPGVSRAAGPFVNPDHFANYLSLIVPLALVGALFRTSIAPRGIEEAFRLLCGFAILVLFSGILLSLSRAAWIGMLLGAGILFLVFPLVSEGKAPFVLRKRRLFVICTSLVTLCLLLALTLLFVGPDGRTAVANRLQQTTGEDPHLLARVSIWKSSLGMVRDFPLFGVGLGTWPELFPRYQGPPRSEDFFRETHNDYLELLAETGVIGFGLLSWFFCRVGRRLVSGLKMVPAKDLPVYAPLLSALGVMAFHEFLDFNLQIPANAFLFTLFLALSLRMAIFPVASNPTGFAATGAPRPSVFQVFLPAAIGVVTLMLLVVALNQERIPYPYNLKEPPSLSEAREVLFAHPARASSHLALFRLLEHRAPLSWQFNELGISLWLDPLDPHARDLYAMVLLRLGKREEGLEEITRSVFYSPSLSTHFYLSQRLWPWLSAAEQRAVEVGFQKALANGYAGVVESLGTFYAGLGRFSDQARLYEEAAQKEKQAQAKADIVINAGLAYAMAGEGKKAESLFRQAVLVAPEDLRPYRHLLTSIYVPQRDIEMAKAIVAQGIKNGADPFSLYFVLGEAAEKAGNRKEAEAAFLQAIAFRPSSHETLSRLGHLYLQENNFDQAAPYFARASELNPRSAGAFYYLGVAEEGRYRFFEAEKAYARALELAPDQTRFQRRYEAFKQKVAANTKDKIRVP